MTIIQFEVGDNTKKEASLVFKKLGLDLSTALRLFLKRSVDLQGMPK